ncbi:putative secreted protein (Por secretion system target) [Ulvibacter sp. MAR_2010_11]|uniref:T9SS type A sorting domain-containing protein n=1 Tax=Ulvibacter sp. MAR_2010_11 TaxID=1250229 RepID=UPI000C2B5CD5|nr:T9SS type A sorting domain-containing protein [Ulvibacter sp. MAR_2010_11]PKA83820.1 putative secreted protein (Por secretion system target) [Ulvibacter sp. MAR_2010_11]
MKRIVLFTLLLISHFSKAQTAKDLCSYGIITENSGSGVNIETGGGNWEYAGATDFDVPFGTIFTATQVKMNVVKGSSDLSHLNLTFWTEASGFPFEVIQDFPNLVPISQIEIYEIDPDLSVYEVTIDLPNSVTFERGKYFMQAAGVPGGPGGVWWEITDGLNQSVGVFDYISFDQGITWEGTGYGDYVMTILGDCIESGEEFPYTGAPCEQGDVTNGHEEGADLLTYRVVDDFIVEANTIFTLAHFDLFVMSMGPGINNATIKIRSSINDAPGDVLHTFEQLGPTQEQFFDYWPWSGVPPFIPVLKLYFDFDSPVSLTEGRYFIEIVPHVYATDAFLWEGTSQGGTGGYSYTSFDNGNSWVMNEGYHQVFTVGGYCESLLGVVDNDIENMVIYPLPAEDFISIKGYEDIKSVNIYDLSGKLIGAISQSNGRWDVSTIASGTYLLKIVLENEQTKTFKIVKK